jgi:hypothetical protein
MDIAYVVIFICAVGLYEHIINALQHKSVNVYIENIGISGSNVPTSVLVFWS